MPNSFNCTNGRSYLLRNVFDMTLAVYNLIDMNSKPDLAEVTISIGFLFIVMYQPNRSFNIPPPGKPPGI